jgi:hypothetical protein
MNNETCKTRLMQGPRRPVSINTQLPISHAVRVKNAEYWLRLGEADEAVRELESLPQTAWNHPSAVKARVAALEVLAQRREAIVQEVQAE